METNFGGNDFKEFAALEKMFPNGFFILRARPDGCMQYARFNPRRINLIEDVEKWLVDTADATGPNFWRGFITKDQIPDFFPKDWDNTGDTHNE